jgi:hypothetical protein
MLWQIHGNPKDANVRFSASGDNTLVAAPTGTNMFIHALILNPAAAVTVKIKLGARQVGGDIDLIANQSFNVSDLSGMDGLGFYECKSGEAFIVNLSSAVSVTGYVKYSYIDTTL